MATPPPRPDPDISPREIEVRYRAALAKIRAEWRRLSDEDAWRRIEHKAPTRDEET